MLQVDIYARVRNYCLVEGKSQRLAARVYQISRRSVAKMLEHSEPPGYQQTKPRQEPKLGVYKEFICELIEQDKQVRRKQRHTAKRIYERLRDEHGYQGSERTVRHYVAKYRQQHKEVFCPLSHSPGASQVDFGEARAIIGGQEVKIHFFVMSLPFSDGLFVKAYPSENTESFIDGHVASFEYFGGVATRIVYDNSTIAVSRILKAGERKTTQGFRALQSHYLFKATFARIRKGNDKGMVENLIGYVRRNFMVPLPQFASFAELNDHLRVCTEQRHHRILRGHEQPIHERMQEDKSSFLSLPGSRYEACNVQTARVSSQALVRYKCNDYSVPGSYGYRDVIVKGFVDEVVIIHGANVIARHPRCYGREEVVFNPLHYLAILERKTGAFDQAAPLKDWVLPSCFGRLRNCLESASGKEGTREYIRVLRLMESFTEKEVESGVTKGLQSGVHNHEAIKHLILHDKDPPPPPMDISQRCELAAVNVNTTSAVKYGELVAGRSA